MTRTKARRFVSYHDRSALYRAHFDAYGMRGITLAVYGVLVFVIIVSVAFFVDRHETNACTARGGEMVKTGETTTVYVMSGKVLVPVTTEDTACTV
jgi:hypothetical protein